MAAPHLHRYPLVRRLFLVTSIALATLAGGSALAASNTAAPQAASAGATTQATPHETVQIVDAFMAALADGQLEAARQYMTPDAVVMANGQVLGNRDAYIDGAARGDVAALRGVQRELVNRGVSADADIGWVVSEKRMRAGAGAQAARAIGLTETMLLAKTPSGWKITHIHWSSHAEG
jgi:ketosteroid isomerase-like protein